MWKGKKDNCEKVSASWYIQAFNVFKIITAFIFIFTDRPKWEKLQFLSVGEPSSSPLGLSHVPSSPPTGWGCFPSTVTTSKSMQHQLVLQFQFWHWAPQRLHQTLQFNGSVPPDRPPGGGRGHTTQDTSPELRLLPVLLTNRLQIRGLICNLPEQLTELRETHLPVY